MKPQPTIAIISGRKKTDALLCKTLAEYFPNQLILQYQIPTKTLIPWLWLRISKMGIYVLIDHLLLAGYLRLVRAKEIVQKKSLWSTFLSQTPSWKQVSSTVKHCSTESELLDSLLPADFIVVTDSIRLSHRLFRKLKQPCLQIVWGMAPKYMGDSAGFWSFATGDLQNTGVSIIRRTSQFDTFAILKTATIHCEATDDLRTIKIKQAILISKLLPEVIQNTIQPMNNNLSIHKYVTGQIFQAPTFTTYLKFLQTRKIVSLPSYSFSKKRFHIIGSL